MDESEPQVSPRLPEGFSLIEVMITGIAVILMIVGLSQILDQGLFQQRQRLEQSWVISQMDHWTANLFAEGFNHQNLSPGLHQKVIESPVWGTYQLTWQVEQLVPLLKIISIQLHPPSESSATLYRWKISISAWKYGS